MLTVIFSCLLSELAIGYYMQSLTMIGMKLYQIPLSVKLCEIFALAFVYAVCYLQCLTCHIYT